MTLLVALLALAASYLARPSPAIAGAVALPALLACVVAGLTFPDIDQPLPLDHRSALTHSIAPALALTIAPWARAAAAGLALGLGLHLAADIFPDAMVGYATVAVPFAGRLGAQGSYLWLAANAAACGVAGTILLARSNAHPGLQAVAALGTALIGLWYLPRVDGGWPALALVLGAGWLVLRRLRARAEAPELAANR